jgi:hypothetical protein
VSNITLVTTVVEGLRNGPVSEKKFGMEEEDEIVPHPDIRGLLDLTNRAWVHLDPIIWTM